MFGLTKREQRWKAEQRAVETLIGIVGTVVKAAAEVRIAEAMAAAKANASEVDKLRAQIAELKSNHDKAHQAD